MGIKFYFDVGVRESIMFDFEKEGGRRKVIGELFSFRPLNI